MQSKANSDCYILLYRVDKPINKIWSEVVTKIISSILNSIIFGTFLISMTSFAADDPTIKGNLRTNISQAMSQYVEDQTIDGKIDLYDAVDGKLLSLTFDSLHAGIVKKEGFFVSCADFMDQQDRLIDIDFLVKQSGNTLKVTQAIVHSIDGEERVYHLENN